MVTIPYDTQYQEYRKASYDQQQVDALLRRGIIFSIVWLAGIGSTYAVICAIRAMRIKRRSKYRLRGTLRVLWCLIVGGGGALFLAWVAVTYVMYMAGVDLRW